MLKDFFFYLEDNIFPLKAKVACFCAFVNALFGRLFGRGVVWGGFFGGGAFSDNMAMLQGLQTEPI